MSVFIEVRALGGTNYVRAREVIAVQYADPQKCVIMLAGGVTLPCAEPASQVKARIEAAVLDDQANSETSHGNASR